MEEQFDNPEYMNKSVRGRDLLTGVLILWFLEVVFGVSLVMWLGRAESIAEHPIELLIMTVVSGSTTVFVTWLLVCKKYHKTLIEGFLIRRPKKKELIIAMFMGIVLAIVGQTVANAFSTGTTKFFSLVAEAI